MKRELISFGLKTKNTECLKCDSTVETNRYGKIINGLDGYSYLGIYDLCPYCKTVYNFVEDITK